jgi:hypothetical protein
VSSGSRQFLQLKDVASTALSHRVKITEIERSRNRSKR